MQLALRDFHPTNTTTHRHSVDRWFNFIAGFSPEFVQACLNECTSTNRLVLDPFTGCGTVQVQANKLGWRSVGFEPHPIFYRIAEAKSKADVLADALPRIRLEIENGLGRPVCISGLKDKPREYLIKLFQHDTLSQLLGAKARLEESELAKNDLAFLVLTKVLDLCSKSQTDGIYKAPTSKKRAHDPFDATEFVISNISDDISDYRSQQSELHNQSSQKMDAISDRTVSCIITSPPYLNNFDFAEMTRMQIYFWDIADSWGDITEKVRRGLIVNTTTALRGHKDIQADYRSSLPPHVLKELDSVVHELQDERASRAGKKEYDFLVYPYFSQMQDVLREAYRVLEAKGHFHIMVADAALYGVHISTPQILTEIMQEIGFTNVHCEFVRPRGHRWILDKRDGSKKGLGEYHIFAEGA